jgi:hypothetical protein
MFSQPHTRRKYEVADHVLILDAAVEATAERKWLVHDSASSARAGHTLWRP